MATKVTSYVTSWVTAGELFPNVTIAAAIVSGTAATKELQLGRHDRGSVQSGRSLPQETAQTQLTAAQRTTAYIG